MLLLKTFIHIHLLQCFREVWIPVGLYRPNDSPRFQRCLTLQHRHPLGLASCCRSSAVARTDRQSTCSSIGVRVRHACQGGISLRQTSKACPGLIPSLRSTASYQILENTLYTTIRCNVLKCFLQICPIIETWYGVDCLHLVCLSHFQAHPISCQFLNFFLFVSVRWLIDIVSFWEHIKILSLYFLHRVYTFVSNVYVLNSFAILWHFENVHMFSLFAKSWSIALSADLAKPFSRQRLPANTDVYIYFICSYSRSCTTVDMQKASSSSFIWSGRQIAF